MVAQMKRQGLGIIQALSQERLDPEQVYALQTNKVRSMITHAWQSSPFYQAKMRTAGITPADIRTMDDLRHFPITTKQELRTTPSDQLLATGYTTTNTIHEPTSGSSGKVFHVYHSKAAFDTYFANAFRHLWSIGYRPWHRVAYTAFDPLITLPWERFGLGVREQINLREPDAQSFLKRLLDINPQLITAYPSILLMIIRVASDAQLRQIRPRAVHLHSELLTEGIRDIIRLAFDCDCFDDYSTCEFHHVTHECRYHQYHIAADNVVVEVLNDGQPASVGQNGEIVITGLTNYAQPIIRYAIGDVGALGTTERCACGSGFPTMALIQGRVDDFVVLPSGRRISPRIVNPAFEHLPGMLEHVLVQETLDTIKVYVNIMPGYAESTMPMIRQNLHDLFREPVELHIIPTTTFERGRTGKLRCVISKVHQASSHIDIVRSTPPVLTEAL
ncbi:hypothetical protein [Herpetosiphon gulosus]|uniref:Phenylacetate-coenzyme A ligase n=1 Tax=Herpetosiphon gulosus TaxID=1973496 RepID=A0ABP9X7Z1_9CHLR